MRRVLRKVLVANRGEIAVRVIRACRDAGLASVAVYADPDRDGLPARFADEAYALGGRTASETYLRGDRLLEVAARAGADAVHPGYGFLAEDARFAEAVTRAGLTWIGPPAAAIRALGDKVTARRLARRAGAPLVAGTDAPVASAAEVLEFARRHGLPVAIKAAYGGGGRGLRVAHTLAEIPDQYEAAVREATAAFGRGECFVERYLERPRHVEAQVLADQYGTVVVVGTRDCTLQRRHQKMVEEAPAPFLTDEQQKLIRESAAAICRQAGYHGAGTVEFLLGADGTISFLEVNTRLQVEHPVTEETTGLDLVREQFRIAAGEPLDIPADPVPRGHAIEFRITGEDPGRGFLPTPGTVTALRLPSGPGVRVDAGIEAGEALDSGFDSLLAKIVVTGRTRAEALARARRALDEAHVEGVATVLPFHRSVVRDPAFTAEPFTVHTRWIETEWTPVAAAGPPAPLPEPEPRETVVVEVAGKRLEVGLPADLVAGGAGRPSGGGRAAARRRPERSGAAVAAPDALVSPMQGTIVKVAVADGDAVAEGDPVVVLEAMKMEQPLTAHKAGRVVGLTAAVGDVVAPGAVICTIA